MDGDSEEKVIVMQMNRPKPGLAEKRGNATPGELADDRELYEPDRVRDRRPEPEALPDAGEQDYQPPPKKSDPLPRPGDAYRAHARFLNRLQHDQRLIHFVDRNCWCEGYAYSDLRRVRWLAPAGEGTGPVIELRFVESVITDVRIEGRNLEDVHHWISEGTMPWVWERPTGFKTRDDNAVVITRITLQTVER
jgi:hypothetical protein